MENKSVTSPGSPHFWWIISCFIVVIVVLVVILIQGQTYLAQDVIEFISTIALLLSIILSILAIAFTYTSNIQAANQFDKINDAAARIGETSVKLSSVTDDIIRRLSRLEGLQEQINKKIDNTNSSVPEMEKAISNPVPKEKVVPEAPINQEDGKED
ncbi:MAG: hypothetical protein LIR46_10465 [Bacteroidota bacterium]|nr:hypothetical protein [Bacteroidota bacterium]